MNKSPQIMQHEFTHSYIKNAPQAVLQDMYQKIHEFLWNQTYRYKKPNKFHSEDMQQQIFLKDVLRTLLNRIQERKKKYIYMQHAKGKIQSITSDMLKYTWTDALRELLLLIPKIKKHPEVLQKRITRDLSYEEKKQQHALVPKYMRCVTGTKKLLETILLWEDKIFTHDRQHELQLELFPQSISNPAPVTPSVSMWSNKSIQQQQAWKSIASRTSWLTPEDIEALYNDSWREPEHKWQILNNR